MGSKNSNRISLSINGNELIFKLEFHNSNQVFINNFSLENLTQINDYFLQCRTLIKCKEKLKTNIQLKKQII